MDAAEPKDTGDHRFANRRSVAQQLAGYVETARSQPIPAVARTAALRCILDLMAAAGAGLAEPGPRAVRNAAHHILGAGSVPIWFTGGSSGAVGAAWANSAAASVLDLDDGHRLARGHPGAAVIPTALAVAHQTGATLDELIAAIVIGYEVGVTVGAARLSYGNTGTWSSYAVVAAAAALRKTPSAIIEHALAIAGESSPNQLFASAPAQVPPPEGSDVKEGIPWSVVTGLIALELAENGHTGPRNILDAATHYRFPAALALGAQLHICSTYFKLYACCRHVHAPLDALLGLMSRHKLQAADISQIEVRTYGGALRISNTVEPANLIDVQYSIPYCLALAAVAGPRSLLPLTGHALEQPGVRDLAKKVRLELDPVLDARFPAETLAQVTITCGARSLASEVTAPRGEATSPLSWSDLEGKLRDATRFLARADQQARVLSVLRGLQDKDLGPFQRTLAEEVFDQAR